LSAFGLGLEAGASRKAGELSYGGSQTADVSGIQQFLGRLVSYIPADIVGGYVVVIGFISASAKSNTAQWVIAAVFLALTPVVVVTTYLSKVTDGDRKPARWPWYRVAGSAVAFCTWVFALPASPFDSIGGYAPWLRPLIMVVVTILLTCLAPVLDVTRGL
jgi:hypothetical protein